jgi:hypothetical protein
MLAVSSATEHFRGVLCRHCGKPVRVPGLVLRKDRETQGYHDASDSHYQLISRVFVLRCRACQREGIYSISQILDCCANQPVANDSHGQAAL